MVKVYNSIKDEHGNLIAGVTKLFIISTQSDHTIGKFISGIACVPEGNGTMFIVDEWIINQVDKVQFKDGALSVKDGEELIPPVKTEKELQREALLKQIAELDSQPSE
ncbi:hypothetical protein [Jeotgalicoccus sp. WY2]|uniref:hypothetical protein n=1 Tax=Jeotgalicoccus sp. WY2 TaxID=2708346 RepID=UPI001BD27EB6|nr:hypothetical protein [Jeotgalicoccus sp. WY2]